MRLHNTSASSMECVVSTIARRLSFLQSYNMFQSYLRVSGSKPVVGSSKNTILGLATKLMAIDSLRFIPSGSFLVSMSLSLSSCTSFIALFTIFSSSSGATPLSLA